MKNTDVQENKNEKLTDFAVLSAWLITCLGMAIIAYAQFGQDFRGYYAAGMVLLAGGNPYDYYQVAPVLMEVTGRIGNNPFYYPLWFGWFVSPLALLPYQIARGVWMLFNLIVWIIGLFRLRHLLDWPRVGWRTWGLNLLATFIFAWFTWKFEQTGILLFALTVEIIIAYKKHQSNLLGILLAAALIKPNVALIPVSILCLWLVRNKNYRPVIVMSVLLVGLIGITTLLTPGWYQPLLEPNFGQGLTEVLDGPEKTTGIRLNTTMLDWLKMLQTPEQVAIIIYGLAITVCLLIVARLVWKSKSIWEVAVIALLVNFVITPYALQYDFAPLTVVLFWGLASAIYAGSIKVPAVLVAFIASVLIWERPISDGYWIVIGLSLLVFWSMKLNKDIQFPERLN